MPENPYAFPQPMIEHAGAIYAADDYGKGYTGMRLRDYFAGQALTGLLLHYHEDRGIVGDVFSVLAGISYQYADAMLSAREKKTEASNA